MSGPLFGLLIEDRTPYAFEHFPGLFQAWVQDAGGFAALGLVVYLWYALRIPAAQAESAKDRAGVTPFMLVMAVLAVLCYAVYFFLVITGKGGEPPKPPGEVGGFIRYEPPPFSLLKPQAILLSIGGLFAILGVGQPFVSSLLKVKFRRLWALSLLGFKEAIHNRVLLSLLLLLIPMMLPISWFLQSKPENELRNTVDIHSGASQIMLLLMGVLLAAFAIPNDIKNQNLYTIVTKPVERFEVLFGRFVGFVSLMTAALLLVTLVGWVFIVTTNIDKKAKEETFKARVPVKGKLSFQNRRGEKEGTNVGREFDYRKYIAGDPSTSERAVWTFDRFPSDITEKRDHVPVEFTFDIFRMTKGEENRGVDLIIRVVTWQCGQVPPTDPRDGTWKWADAEKEQQYKDDYDAKRKELNRSNGLRDDDTTDPLRNATPGSKGWPAVNELAKKHGFYERSGKEIFDYHTDAIAVPVGLFENAKSGDPKASEGKPAPPRVSIYVKCNTRGQLLGMAVGDLYVLSSERSFHENYFKSSFGLWCRVCIIIGLATALSTYLSGVIGLLATGLLFLAGYISEHLNDIASGNSFVGGPFRSMNQILRAEQPTAQTDTGAIGEAATFGDRAVSWLFRRVSNLIPDVESYVWTEFLSEGFNIPLEFLVMNLVVMIGYLLPWFVLGYYLLRSREIAE